VIVEIRVDALAEVLGGHRLDEFVGGIEVDNRAVGVRAGIALSYEEDAVIEQTRPPAICDCTRGLDHGTIHRRFWQAPVLAVKGRTQVVLGEWIGLGRRSGVGGRPAPWSVYSAEANSGDNSGYEAGEPPRARRPKNDLRK
jgi:hypothetical protein